MGLLALVGKPQTRMGKGWQTRTTQSPLPDFRETDNLGLLLSPSSADLIRLDPDYPLIPAVTALLFQEPTPTFGRPRAPHTGRLITSTVKSKASTCRRS